MYLVVYDYTLCQVHYLSATVAFVASWGGCFCCLRVLCCWFLRFGCLLDFLLLFQCFLFLSSFCFSFCFCLFLFFFTSSVTVRDRHFEKYLFSSSFLFCSASFSRCFLASSSFCFCAS